jgi:hypothetical protein
MFSFLLYSAILKPHINRYISPPIHFPLLLHHPITRPPRLNLGLAQLAQLIHSRGIPRRSALRNIELSSSSIRPHNYVCNGVNPDPDDADARIVRPAIVNAIAQAVEPSALTNRISARTHGWSRWQPCPMPTSTRGCGWWGANVDLRFAGDVIRL